MDIKEHVFYEDGLRFECTRCSNCCRHEPGYVFLTSRDLKDLQKVTGLTTGAVIEKYCRKVYIGFVERISLKEKANFDCIFWEENGCQIYTARPLQCRSYPFWSSHLISRESWDREGVNCPGINKGTLHSCKSIEKWMRMRERNPLLPVENA